MPDRYVEDVYGQASVRISERLEKIDPLSIKDIDGYIARTCINCAIDQLRRSGREADMLVRLAALPEDVNDHDEVVASERYLIVREVIAEVLTGRQHLAYVLRHVKELNAKEIGEVLGISHALARKELSAAQQALDKGEVKGRLRALVQEER
ncbi:RNA polymerase sigma factor [Streptomyces sp. NPDC007007]|uniref:RNA polymerase sigma factor n=1 Tax=Streptomyces sp. NPDC007007 TaxID=3364770 RepID=UPI0036C70FB9